MKDEISKHLHNLRGSLGVVAGFVRYVDKKTLNPEGQKFYEACQTSLARVETVLEELGEMAKRSSE